VGGLVDNVPLAVKAQDVVGNAARAAGLELVLMAEELLAREAAAVVQNPVR
jgi:hypothetical protein